MYIVIILPRMYVDLLWKKIQVGEASRSRSYEILRVGSKERGRDYVVFANGYESCGMLEAAMRELKKIQVLAKIELHGEVHRFVSPTDALVIQTQVLVWMAN